MGLRRAALGNASARRLIGALAGYTVGRRGEAARVAARIRDPTNRKVTMRKAVLFSALVVALAFAGTAAASDPIILPTGQEGCVSPSGDTCTYTTTRDGGYVANGSTWTVTVEIPANGDPRDTNLDGKLRYVFNPGNAPAPGCGFFAAGSTVTTNAGANAAVAAGNPIPGATDPALGSSNDCSTGKVAAGNPNYTPVD
jgi:hypothetical protein